MEKIAELIDEKRLIKFYYNKNKSYEVIVMIEEGKSPDSGEFRYNISILSSDVDSVAFGPVRSKEGSEKNKEILNIKIEELKAMIAAIEFVESGKTKNL